MRISYWSSDVCLPIFIVRDSGKPKAAVLTGSTNFTQTDTGTNATTGAGAGQNLNHVVVLHSQKAATEYLQEFNRMRTGTFGRTAARRVGKDCVSNCKSRGPAFQ